MRSLLFKIIALMYKALRLFLPHQANQVSQRHPWLRTSTNSVSRMAIIENWVII